jgi:hypothetical protein
MEIGSLSKYISVKSLMCGKLVLFQKDQNTTKITIKVMFSFYLLIPIS